jgi:hypothetical protein
MKHKHNKKRNIGIVYELLLRHITSNLIENNKTKADQGLQIISKYFKNNTELYREFRLFNAMAKSTLSDTSVAAAVLLEAKVAIRGLDYVKLNREKSSLIKEINHKLNDENFYSRKIPDYTVYANIQNMFNEWKKNDSANLKKSLDYEKEVMTYLLKEKEKPGALEENLVADRLVLKIMTEKINTRYGSQLNSEQKKLLSEYTFNQAAGDNELKAYLIDYKLRIVESLAKFKKKEKNEILLEKIDSVIKRVKTINTDDISDNTISKFMTIAKLREEIEGAK